MELWFTERHTPYVNFSIKVERQLYTAQSEFQRIDVFESREFGRFLTLDGYMMLTEKDEFIYHEMMVHVPMAVLGEKIKKVLVIGGGDVAMDAAITAKLLGAAQVRICCLEAEDAMPAFPHNIADARARGVDIEKGWGVMQVNGKEGRV